jgi:putative tryptophan/tyrosine transport system substrate-binding protein
MADMKRRDFIRLAGGMAAAWPLAARAQQAKRIPRIGILLFAKADLAVIDPCIRGLEALGYVDGKTVHLEYRDAGGNYGRFSELADELARLNSDVIFSFGGDIAPAIKKATTNIPIVVVVSNDPVESGLVASLARPGGNITGLTYVHDMLAGKSVELLKDTVPSVSRVAILWNPNHADPDFARRSAPRAPWGCNCNRSRCANRPTSRAHSKHWHVSAPRLSSSSDPASLRCSGSGSGMSVRSRDSSWSACRAG